jgi:hypothetical protein
MESSEIVFFLGAGASVAADVPDTFSFVDKYIKNIEVSQKRETIKDIIEKLKQWKAEQGKEIKVDIEDLLESLTKLKNRDQEPLLAFIEGGHFITDGYYDKQPLIDELKDFIKSKAIVLGRSIQYLQPLHDDFIREYGSLSIISVNYDTCIEQFCNTYKLTYQDGFDAHWNPDVFEKSTNIRLFKLHGSVMWYQSERGDYKKSDVMTERREIRSIFNEKAENLMLYPMQKLDYVGPLLELLVKVKGLLESETCRFLIIIGYSFRDELIRRIIWDAARKNKELHLILIDPNAYQIYSKKLKYYDDNHTIHSSLDGKVICLPYLFERVFPSVKNYLNNLKVGLKCENARNKEECLRHFIEAEYTEKVESINFDLEQDLKLSLEHPLKMGINLAAGGENEKAADYIQMFWSQLTRAAVDRMKINILSSHSRQTYGISRNYQVEFQFNYIPHPANKGSSYQDISHFKAIIESLSLFCDSREGFVTGDSVNKIQKISDRVKKIKIYLDLLKDGKVDFDDYLKFRGGNTFISELKKEYENIQIRGLDTKLIESKIGEIERSILKEIIEKE